MESNAGKKLALISGVGLIPATIIVSAGLLQTLLGYTGMNDMIDRILAEYRQYHVVIDPAILIGGLVLCVGANALQIFRVRFQVDQESLSATLTLRRQALNVWLFGLGAGLFSTLLLYALAENFRLVMR